MNVRYMLVGLGMVLVLCAVLTVMTTPSVGQQSGPKPAERPDSTELRLQNMHLQMELMQRRVERLSTVSCGGRWQLVTLPNEHVTQTHPPTRYTAGHTLFLLDTQTGMLVKVGASTSDNIVIHEGFEPSK